MVEVHKHKSGESLQVVVRPNRAMSWRGLLVCYTGIAVISLGIAIYFFLQGYPLILPFSGIELLLLAYALYTTAWRGNWQEVVTIANDKVMVEQGVYKPEACHEFQRSWASVKLQRSWNSWYPSELYIVSHGKQLEIGAFLNDQERQGLAKLLRKLIQEPQFRSNSESFA